MEKISKAIMRALGAKPNGTPRTSCVEDSSFVKQMLLLIGISFTLGGMFVNQKEIPNRLKTLEERVVKVESLSITIVSIDDRLARIENALIRR